MIYLNMLKSISRRIENFIEEQTQYDTADTALRIREELGYLHLVTGLYLDLRTTTGMILTLVTFLMNIYNSVQLPTLILVAIRLYKYERLISYASFIFSAASVIGLTTYFWLIFNRRTMGKCFLVIFKHFFHYKYEIEERNDDKWKKFQIIFKKTTNISIFILIMIVASFTFYEPQSSKRYINGVDFSFPFPACYPFNVDSPLLYYFVLFSQIYYCAQVIALMMFGFHTYLLFGSYLVIQYRRLMVSLDAIVKRAELVKKKKMKENGGCDIETCYRFCLKENVEHHKVILKFQEDYKVLVSAPVFMVYGFTSYAMAMATVIFYNEIDSVMPRILGAGVMIICLLSTSLISWIGGKIWEQTEDFFFAIYKVKWYNYKKRTTACLRIMMSVSFKERKIVALHILPIDLEALASLMRAAYSAFNVITALQIQNKKN